MKVNVSPVQVTRMTPANRAFTPSSTNTSQNNVRFQGADFKKSAVDAWKALPTTGKFGVSAAAVAVGIFLTPMSLFGYSGLALAGLVGGAIVSAKKKSNGTSE